MGQPNRITTDIRHKINQFLNDNWERVQADFNKLEPKDRLSFYERLMQYGLPKLQSTTLTTDFESMSDEQLDFVIETLLNQCSGIRNSKP